MHFTPAETEKLLLSVAAMVARDRLERGILLNHPETVALLSCWVIIPMGLLTYATLRRGRTPEEPAPAQPAALAGRG